MLSLDLDRLELMRTRSQRSLVGEIGEQIVHQLYGGTRSLDLFDDAKDIITADGVLTETKTQNRVTLDRGTPEKADYFSIRWAAKGQKHYWNFQKCQTVARLLFVEYVPISTYSGPYQTEIHDMIRVFDCKDRRKLTKRYRTEDGRLMFGFPISLMTLVHEEHNPAVAILLRTYSQSGKL